MARLEEQLLPIPDVCGSNPVIGKIYTGHLFTSVLVFIVKMADHEGNHRCLIEKNVPIVLILLSRWQDGAESLGMETTCCLREVSLYD